MILWACTGSQRVNRWRSVMPFSFCTYETA